MSSMDLALPQYSGGGENPFAELSEIDIILSNGVTYHIPASAVERCTVDMPPPRPVMAGDPPRPMAWLPPIEPIRLTLVVRVARGRRMYAEYQETKDGQAHEEQQVHPTENGNRQAAIWDESGRRAVAGNEDGAVSGDY